MLPRSTVDPVIGYGTSWSGSPPQQIFSNGGDVRAPRHRTPAEAPGWIVTGTIFRQVCPARNAVPLRSVYSDNRYYLS